MFIDLTSITIHIIHKSHPIISMTKPPIKIKLLTGEQIHAFSIHITHTYAGWIDGVPTMETNQEQLSELPNYAQKIFGKNPVHVVPPSFKTPEIAHWKGHGTALHQHCPGGVCKGVWR